MRRRSFTNEPHNFFRIRPCLIALEEWRKQLSWVSRRPPRAAPGGLLSAISAGDLIPIMREFRARTLDLVADLDDEQLIGPRLAIVNPPLWEIGHVAWFAEYWILRHLRKQAPIIENGDQLYNSTDVAHDTRWELLLPSLEETRADIWTRFSIAALSISTELPSSLRKSFTFTCWPRFTKACMPKRWRTRGKPSATPRRVSQPTRLPQTIPAGPFPGDAEVPGGTFLIGATPDFPFAFDNEKWAHAVEIKPFRIARAPVTNGEFLAFVEDGGYRKAQFWSEPGWRWLEWRCVS